MSKTIRAKVKGTFTGVASLRVNDNGEITDVLEIQDVEDTDDIEIVYQIGG